MKRPIDVEDAVRGILKDNGITAYCRPLPETYPLPSILVTATGGNQDTDWHGIDQLDNFTVNLSCRGEDESTALACLRSAIGILQSAAGGTLSRVTVNSLYSWGRDATRPELAMCGSTIIVTARPETFTQEETI